MTVKGGLPVSGKAIKIQLPTVHGAMRTTMVQTVPHFVSRWRECTLVTVKGGLSVSKTTKIQPQNATVSASSEVELGT